MFYAIFVREKDILMTKGINMQVYNESAERLKRKREYESDQGSGNTGSQQ